MSALIVSLMLLLIYALFIALYWSLLIRRAHDLGYSGWITLLYLLPLVNLLMLIYFLCAKGEESSNAYGEPNVGKPFWSSIVGRQEASVPAVMNNPASMPPPPPPAASIG